MHQVSDPPTAAQVGQMLERLNNLADDVREIKEKQSEANVMLIALTTVQRDLSYVDERVRHLVTVSEARNKEISGLDKRATLLERWRSGLVALAFASLGAIGYAWQRIEYVGQLDTHVNQLDTRVSTLELIVNKPKIESAMTPGRKNERR